MKHATICLLALVLAVPACRQLNYSLIETVPEEKDVAVGSTTYRDVIRNYGAPMLLAEAPGGFGMFYEHILIGEGSLGLKLSEAGYWGSSAGNRQYFACLLLFDQDGVLRSFLSQNSDLRVGGGFQAATSGKDGGAKDYGVGPSPFYWGMRGLNPLPILLNDRWGQIEVGQSGLEFFDTPRDAGQHTLSRPVPEIPKEFIKLEDFTP